MTKLEITLLLFYGAIVAVWPLRHLVITIVFRWMDYLTPQSPLYQGRPFPLVTAIIPAKDEEKHLRQCLQSVLAQNYPALEILVVDDRSTDGTASIASEIAALNPRVQVVLITELPAGWTGKTHALHVASSQARGDWLWFIDADTLHEPESLSIAMEYGRSNKAQLVSLLPEMRCESFWERVVQPLMGIVLMRSFPLFQVNRDDHPLAFANGQYLLISHEAYRSIGGHSAVRDRFVEDIHIARKVKGLGLPIRVAIGQGIGSTRMYTSLPQLSCGWSRILYDALDRSPWPLLGKIIEPFIFSQTGTIAFVAALILKVMGRAEPFASWLLLLSLIHHALQVSVLYRFYRLQSPKLGPSALWYPLAGVVSDWILLKAILMCFTGQVSWRGTSYGPNNPTRRKRAPCALRT